MTVLGFIETNVPNDMLRVKGFVSYVAKFVYICGENLKRGVK